jgi:hypothetical protein
MRTLNNVEQYSVNGGANCLTYAEYQQKSDQILVHSAISAGIATAVVCGAIAILGAPAMGGSIALGFFPSTTGYFYLNSSTWKDIFSA